MVEQLGKSNEWMVEIAKSYWQWLKVLANSKCLKVLAKESYLQLIIS